MSSSKKILFWYAPDCTFSSRKMKKHPPPLGRYAPSGLVASLPRKDCAPPPPKCFGSLRHCRDLRCGEKRTAARVKTSQVAVMMHAVHGDSDGDSSKDESASMDLLQMDKHRFLNEFMHLSLSKVSQ